MIDLIELFLVGFGSYFGPCLLYCTPIIFPYIISTREKIVEKIKALSIFLIARFIAHILLGLLISAIGTALLKMFTSISKYFLLFFNLIILFSGIIIILGKKELLNLCRFIKKNVYSHFDLAILGILFAIFPCAPRLGFWAFILSQSKNIFQGLVFSIAFGLGEILSPIIFVGLFVTLLPNVFNKKLQFLFNLICGGILIIIAIKSIFFNLLCLIQ